MDADDTELVEEATEEKNWKGIALAVLAITVIIGLVVTAIVLVTPAKEEEIELTRLTLDDVLSKKYSPKEFHPSWIKDKEAFTYRDDDGSVLEYDCKSNTTVLIPNSVFKSLNTSVYKLSSDRKYALLAVETPDKINTYSTFTRYTIYNIKTGTTENFRGQNEDERMQYGEWSPKGHDIIFVQHNNLFYHKFEEGRQTQLTFDGINGDIYNAIPDWLYEEEVLKDDHALWWSKDGIYIVYAQFNDTVVRKYSYPFYGTKNKNYAEIRQVAYPKAGTEIPTFKLKVVNLKTHFIVSVNPPSELQNSPIGYYFTTVSWVDNSNFLVMWLNRFQNESLFSMCSPESGNCEMIFNEEGHGAWVEPFKPILISSNGLDMYTIMSAPEGNAGYFKHVTLVKTKHQKRTSGVSKFLTHGEFEVKDIVGINEALDELYYLATPGDARKRHLYSVTIGSKASLLKPITKCLSCDIDEQCQYVTASFSGSGKYYIIGCLGPITPFYILKSTETSSSQVIKSNSLSKDALNTMALPIQRYIDIDIGNGQVMHCKLYLPHAFDDEEITRYPLILIVTGEPGSQDVTEKFELNWASYLSSAKSYIIAFIDGRGSGGRGDKYTHSVYKRLGDLEVRDIITAASYFEGLPYVDTKKMSIFGASYGGYLTAQVLGKQPKGLFECGISVSPITNWLYYDAAFTERYMTTPDINPVGYSTSSVLQHAKNFKHAMFMLVHGLVDVNVNFRGSAELIKALHEEDVHFSQEVYIDQPHNLDSFSRHLFMSFEGFLEECYYGVSAKYELFISQKINGE